MVVNDTQVAAEPQGLAVIDESDQEEGGGSGEPLPRLLISS